MTNFDQIWHKVCSNAGPRPSPRGDKSENIKLYWKYLKIFFSRTTNPISTKLGTKHPCVEWIQVCSNAWSRPHPRGDTSEIGNFYSKYLKVFLSRTTARISTKLSTVHPWDKGIQVCSNAGPRPSPRGDNRENVKLYWKSLKNLLLQNHMANFNQIWHTASLGGGDSSLLKCSATPFSKGR